MSFKKGDVVYDLVYNRIVAILDYYDIHSPLEAFRVCDPELIGSGIYSVRSLNELRKLTKLEKALQ